MICDFCGKGFNYRSVVTHKCFVCKKNFCIECRPFNQSPICIEHFNMIPESKKKEFTDFNINVQNRTIKIRLMWCFLSFIIFMILTLILVSLIEFERYLVLVYSFGFSFIIIAVSILFFKRQKANVLKLWQELTGNPQI